MLQVIKKLCAAAMNGTFYLVLTPAQLFHSPVSDWHMVHHQ